MTTYLPLLNFKTILKALAIGSLMLLYALAFSGQSFATAGINRTINFQGKVVNKTPGTNVADGAYDFTFRLYDAASSGTLLWTENWTGGNQITVTDGIFRANLGSITTFASAGVDFNTQELYLDIAFDGETFGTRIRFAAVPYAINAEKVSGLTVTNTTGTFTLTNAKTFSVANTLSFSGTDSTSFVFPSTSGGTVLTSNAPSQTITSTQTTGTVLAIADSTGLSGAISGQSISLTSSTISQDKTGISFDLSGGTGGTYYDLLGTGSTWSITRAGALTVASCSGCGGGGSTLQQAYAAGETISVTSGEGALSIDLASANFDITAGEGTDTGDFRLWDGTVNWIFVDESADTLALGAAAGSGVTIGGTGITTTNAGLLSVTEGFTTDGTSTFGNDATDTISFTGSVNSNINFLDSATGSSYNVNGSDATGATNAGGALSIRAGNGGASSGDGGALTLAGGTTNSGTAGYIALQTAGTERFRVVGDGTFLFEKGSSVDVILSVTAASGGDRTLTIPQLTADDTFVLVTKAQTLASKTLTSPTLTTSPTAAGATWTDLGTVTTVDINGGSVDGATIGGSSAGAGTFTALGGGDLTLGISDTSATVTTQDTNENLYVDPNGTGYVYIGNGSSSTSPNLFVLDVKSDAEGALTGVEGAMYYNDNSNKFRCYQNTGWTDCIGTGGAGPWTDGTGVTYLTDTAEDLLLGGTNDPTTSGSTTTFFMDVSAGILYLGNDDVTAGAGDTGINGALTFYSSGDATTTDPRIYTDSTGNLNIVAEQSGASVILGDGSGNISLSLTVAADIFLADKTVTLTGPDYTANDFEFKRVLTSDSTSEDQGGAVLHVYDAGAISGGAVANGTLILGNVALTSGSFTGNLLDLQIGGTSKLKTDYQGALTFANSEVMNNTTDDIIAFIGAGGSDNTDLYINLDGTAPVIYSNTDTIVDVDDILNANSITSDAGVSIAAGSSYTGAGAVTLSSGTATGLTINSGTTGTIAIGDDSSAETINLGTGGAAKTVVLGSTNSTSTTTVQSGSGHINLEANSTSTGNVQIGDGGSGSTTPDLLGLDVKSDTGDPSGFEGAMYYNTSDNKFRCYQDAAWTDCIASGSSWTTITKSADERSPVSTTTVQNDDELLFSVEASKTYMVRAYIPINTSDAGADLKYGFNGPSGTTLNIRARSYSTATANIFCNVIALSATQTCTTTVNSAINFLDFVGFVTTNGNSGTFNFQFAQGTSDATDPAFPIVKKGSTLEYQPVNGADLAELYFTKDEEMEAGDVVTLDSTINAGVKKSTSSYDKSLMGVISTKPGLLIGEGGSGGAPVPVALSGRVPVKVTGENGPIKAGDFLTSSSTPGMAMKATKAGMIIGQAITDFNGQGQGTVIMFIKNIYSDGASLDELIPGIEAIAEGSRPAKIIQFLTDSKTSEVVSVSEVNTDRLIAGLEVITPKLFVEEISAKYLKSLDNELVLKLTENGSFIVKDETGKDAIKFDSKGNATFAGVVTADKIKANQIEGLDVIVNNQLTMTKSSESAVLSSNDRIASFSARLEAFLATSSSSMNRTAAFNSDGLSSSSGSLRTRGNALIEGILTVIDTIKANDLIATGLSTFFGEVLFKERVVFEGDVVFGKNMGGQVIIDKGKKSVSVRFEKELAIDPIVNASIYTKELSEEEFKQKITKGECSKEESVDSCHERIAEEALLNNAFVISKKSKKGFTILLKKEATAELNFSWTLINVRDRNEVSSL